MFEFEDLQAPNGKFRIDTPFPSISLDGAHA